MDKDRFTDKTVLITGGNSGLGLATAERLVAEGGKVIITGRNQESLAKAVTALGPRAEGIQADVTDTASLAALYTGLSAAKVTLDGLFVNAGIATFEALEAVTEESFDAMIDTNLRGAFFTVQKAIPLLAKGASIVLNASSAATRGRPSTAVYGATKAALRSLARAMSQGLIERGVRVNTVSPGPIETPIWSGLEGSPAKEAVRQANPSKRFGQPWEVAAAVAYLLSDESAYAVGSDLAVDGGFTQL